MLMLMFAQSTCKAVEVAFLFTPFLVGKSHSRSQRRVFVGAIGRRWAHTPVAFPLWHVLGLHEVAYPSQDLISPSPSGFGQPDSLFTSIRGLVPLPWMERNLQHHGLSTSLFFHPPSEPAPPPTNLLFPFFPHPFSLPFFAGG